MAKRRGRSKKAPGRVVSLSAKVSAESALVAEANVLSILRRIAQALESPSTSENWQAQIGEDLAVVEDWFGRALTAAGHRPKDVEAVLSQIRKRLRSSLHSASGAERGREERYGSNPDATERWKQARAKVEKLVAAGEKCTVALQRVADELGVTPRWLRKKIE